MILHTECVYDVDNHYINLEIEPANWYSHAPRAFILKILETSDEFKEKKTRVYLRRDDLESIIKDLTKLLEAE